MQAEGRLHRLEPQGRRPLAARHKSQQRSLLLVVHGAQHRPEPSHRAVHADEPARVPISTVAGVSQKKGVAVGFVVRFGEP